MVNPAAGEIFCVTMLWAVMTIVLASDSGFAGNNCIEIVDL